MSAKQRVMDLIKKKQQQNKVLKTRSAKRLGPKNIVLEFIGDMESMREEVGDNAAEFDAELKRIARLLESRMMALDPDVNIIVHWNRELHIDSWKDLRVEAVTVEWSRFYMRKNPNVNPSVHIDIGNLFIEGDLD